MNILKVPWIIILLIKISPIHFLIHGFHLFLGCRQHMKKNLCWKIFSHVTGIFFAVAYSHKKFYINTILIKYAKYFLHHNFFNLLLLLLMLLLLMLATKRGCLCIFCCFPLDLNFPSKMKLLFSLLWLMMKIKERNKTEIYSIHTKKIF